MTPRIKSTIGALMILLLVSCGRNLQAQDSLSAIDQVQTRVVKIFGAGGVSGLAAYSTGFLISSEGHIATVWNHVLDPETVTVVLYDGRRLDARVVGAEPQVHLAILKVEAEDLPHFDLADAISVGPGTRVLGFGNMYKVATGDEPVSVLQGVIAAKTRLKARRGTFQVPYDGPVYIVDAVTNNPGTAGGVLTTRDGRLLAMIGQELRNAETNTWINYAIPIGELETIAEEIITGNFTRRDTREKPSSPKNRYQAVDFGIVLVPDVLFRTPAYIDQTVPNGVAARAGLKPNDLLLFVNGELVQSCKEFQAAVGPAEEGDLLQIVVRRGKQLISVELEAPEQEER